MEIKDAPEDQTYTMQKQLIRDECCVETQMNLQNTYGSGYTGYRPVDDIFSMCLAWSAPKLKGANL